MCDDSIVFDRNFLLSVLVEIVLNGRDIKDERENLRIGEICEMQCVNRFKTESSLDVHSRST